MPRATAANTEYIAQAGFFEQPATLQQYAGIFFAMLAHAIVV